ncbi:MAG: 2-C-methyl-D-erythritol 4-phosphate cytidylyltransferase [Bacilli bacterium]|jgi:2-C-methyl-D-erythritol 4-phosphate cytidylyltransferase|nr:2-C-methyl-D-erythritol 4-phosphate cytidylyltransferase [Bacilli bacterium]
MDDTLANFRRVAVLLLGGSGRRFGGGIPKQFALVDGRLLFFYPLKELTASPEVEGVLLVAPRDYLDFVRKSVQERGLGKIIAVIEGGESRQDSSRRASEYLSQKKLPPTALVLIHDADRPNLNEEVIKDNYEFAIKDGAAVTAVVSTDSVALSKDGARIASYLDRNEVYRLQTPQTFVFSLLLDAHEKAYAGARRYTDEGSMVLSETAIAPLIVKGSPYNMKITTRGDLAALGGEKP